MVKRTSGAAASAIIIATVILSMVLVPAAAARASWSADGEPSAQQSSQTLAEGPASPDGDGGASDDMDADDGAIDVALVPLTVELDAPAYEVTEGDEVLATVRLNRISDVPVAVGYSASETTIRTMITDRPATLDRDFSATSGAVTIPAGELEAMITVPTLHNAKHEPNEIFLLSLHLPAPGNTETDATAELEPELEPALGPTGTATVIIQDDDPVDPRLVDDFETHPWLFGTEGDVTLQVREIPGEETGGYPGSDGHENVLDVTHDGPATLSRDFAQGQEWSAYEGMSFWYRGEGDGDEVTVRLADNDGPDPGPDAWTQVWSDEFDGAAGAPADPDNWTYDVGGWGWGNEELQYYTGSTEDAALDGQGNLVITAREIAPSADGPQCWYGPCTHTSARLTSEHKHEFTSGRIESRVRAPQAPGIDPSLWMLGDGFAAAPPFQLDEPELYELASDDWHTFAVEWQPERIDWFVDGILHHSLTPAAVGPDEWGYDRRFPLLMNLAVVGDDGSLGGDPAFPQSLAVDYIRVFQAPETAERFESSFVDDVAGWRQVTVPFDSFARASDQPVGAPDDGLTLTGVRGYGFSRTGAGTVSLDRVMLLDEVPRAPVVPIVSEPTELLIEFAEPEAPEIAIPLFPTPAQPQSQPPVDAGVPEAIGDDESSSGTDGVGFDPTLPGMLILLTFGAALVMSMRGRNGDATG